MGTDCGDEYGGAKKQEDLLQDSYGNRQVVSRYRIHGRGREAQLLLGESQKINHLIIIIIIIWLPLFLFNICTLFFKVNICTLVRLLLCNY